MLYSLSLMITFLLKHKRIWHTHGQLQACIHTPPPLPSKHNLSLPQFPLPKTCKAFMLTYISVITLSASHEHTQLECRTLKSSSFLSEIPVIIDLHTVLQDTSGHTMIKMNHNKC